MRFTKEEFCSAVNKLERMVRENRKIKDILGVEGEWCGDEAVDEYYELIYQMCDIDKYERYDDLSYYCWELDFGNIWYEGCILIDEVDTPCRNAEELWEIMNGK